MESSDSRSEPLGNQATPAEFEAQLRILIETTPTQKIFDTIKGRILQTREIVNQSATKLKHTGNEPSVLQSTTMWLDEKTSRISSLEIDFKEAGQAPSLELVETLVEEIKSSMLEGILIIQGLATALQEASESSSASYSFPTEPSTPTSINAGEQIRVLRNKLDEGEERIEFLQHKLDESTKEIKHLEYSVDTQHRQFKKLEAVSEEQKVELQHIYQQSAHRKEEIDSKENYINHIYMEMKELQERLELQGGALEKARKRELDLKGELAAKTDECKSFEEAHSVDILVKKDAKVTAQHKQIKVLESDLEDWRKENDRQWEEIQQLRTEKEQHKADAATSKQGLANATRYVGDMNKELGDLSQSVDKHLTQGIPFELKQEDLDNGKISKLLKRQRHNLLEQNDRLKSHIEGKNNEIDELMDKLERVRNAAVYGGGELEDGDLSPIDGPEPISPAKFVELETARLRAHSMDAELRQALLKEENEDLREENGGLKQEIEELKGREREKEKGWGSVVAVLGGSLLLGMALLYFGEWSKWVAANGFAEDRYRLLFLGGDSWY